MSEQLLNTIKEETRRYDEIPYESYPFAISHPSHLKTIGALFGLKTPDLKKARVLELGCAAGNNIIPFAANYPQAKVIGIDLSPVQIEQGSQQVEELDLKNIDLKIGSILDIDESWGKFDYIISHGVYSWVPEIVRKKILEVSKENLSPDGVAFISFNTLPGWNIASTARELMRYHSKNFSGIKEQIEQAKSILVFTREATSINGDYYSQIFDDEISAISKSGDSYIRHEYLAESNAAFYFSEFMNDAEAVGLQYLGDAIINTMYPANCPEKAMNQLQSLGDIVRTEQYMDFIINRKFRTTLLCHKNKKLNRNITPNILKKFYFSANLSGENISESNVQGSKEMTFFITGNESTTVSTNSEVMKIALYTMYSTNSDYTTNELVNIVAEKLKIKNTSKIEEELLTNFAALVLKGYAKFSVEPPLYITNISDKPKVSDVALYHAKLENRFWSINQKHFKVALNVVDKLIMQCLDGKHDIKSIENFIFDNYKQGVININIKDQQKPTEKQIRDLINKQIHFSLLKFSRMQLLVA
ncbi:MAG: seryl-tRNA synthetase [Rickettsiaceae bacterium]|jgi:methyltransferase-like protein/trans-aconitate methyltransferase|nr:seryl-tRNA synthetase [Rickettsiaceae bacterium]